MIFRNHLIELIQYEPCTERVARRPLLFVPPWIHKYYIFDLSHENSLVRWALEHGRTVMMISWVDPGAAKPPGATLQDYITDGLEAALARHRPGDRRDAGRCRRLLPGRHPAGRVRRLLRGHRRRPHQDGHAAGDAARLLAAGRTGCHHRRGDADAAWPRWTTHGTVDASALSRTFSLQRRNDLLWSFVVNNYLLGKDAFPQDLLHWIADWMPLPVAMHRSYLRDFYQSNGLIEPGGVTIGGRPLDLRKVRIPIYFLSAREDHIAPWTSIYKAAQPPGLGPTASP